MKATRRKFLQRFLESTVAFPFIFNSSDVARKYLINESENLSHSVETNKSIIGDYGKWAASLRQNPGSLSFRDKKRTELESWRAEALNKTKELLSRPLLPEVTVVIEKKYVFDGLEIEELSWKLPYGRPTKAILLKPISITSPLPAVLGLHDHAGKKYFGYQKIVQTSNNLHPLIEEHQKTDYGGKAWANEIAKRGYVVLVHDAYAFGSRRVYYEDVEGLTYGDLNVTDKTHIDPENPKNIDVYNKWSGEHEHVMSKSLFSAGTTWPGVTLAEDQVALTILSNRKEVDSERIGCGGLSGGGLRTVYLGGIDPRIKCAVCIGFMTTWNDLILNKSFTHTWMTYTPLLSNYLEFPEVLGLRVPLPTLVQNNNQDELYTLSEMQIADKILSEVYSKAGASDKYEGRFYDGEHKFDLQMQSDAFEWFDKWLK